MGNEDKPSRKLKKWLRWGGTLLSGVLFLWILWQQDWDLVIQNLRQLSAVLLFAVWVLFLGVFVVNALRWYALLKAVEINLPFIQAVKIVFLGSFVSNFLPSTIGGDGLRFFSLLHYTTYRAKAGASVVLDRLVSMVSIVFLLPISLITFGNSIIEIFQTGAVSWSALSIFSTEYQNSKRNRWVSRFRKLVSDGINAFRDWFSKPFSLLLAGMISWLAFLLYIVGIWWIARGLGIDIAYYQAIGITVITYLVTLLPISINGYGVREVLMTALYLRLGATIDQASTLAIVTRFLYLLATLPGAIWLSQIDLPKKDKDDSLNPFDEVEKISE
jgi:uncharacterized protein (TIRG00374 family)